jgi:hypothetical protein
MKKRIKGGSKLDDILDEAKDNFQDKLIPGLMFFCNKVEIIPVNVLNKQYNFLGLSGVDGFNKMEGWDISNITMYTLLNENGNNWNIEEEYNLDKETDFFSNQIRKRFGENVKTTRYFINSYVRDTDANTCIYIHVNNTLKTAGIANISDRSWCDFNYKNVSKMTIIFYICFSLLKKVNFSGITYLSDDATKNGAPISVYYMRKNKEDDEKFSKYQDYGFEIHPDSLEKLKEIKREVINNTSDDLKYTEELHDLLGYLDNKDYKKWLNILENQINSVGGRRRKKRRTLKKRK